MHRFGKCLEHVLCTEQMMILMINQCYVLIYLPKGAEGFVMD
jgi:hypothetical protein